jgi:hypothetical protein
MSHSVAFFFRPLLLRSPTLMTKIHCFQASSPVCCGSIASPSNRRLAPQKLNLPVTVLCVESCVIG